MSIYKVAFFLSYEESLTHLPVYDILRFKKKA